MASFIYVHGTGERESQGVIERMKTEYAPRFFSNHTLIACKWGERLGSNHQLPFLSLPDALDAADAAPPPQQEEELAGRDSGDLWGRLDMDPFFELYAFNTTYGMSERNLTQSSVNQRLATTLHQHLLSANPFSDPQDASLAQKLQELGITLAMWQDAMKSVRVSPAYVHAGNDGLIGAHFSIYRDVLARALVAVFLGYLPFDARLATEPETRQALVDELGIYLGQGGSRSPADALVQQAVRGLLSTAVHVLQPRRRRLLDQYYAILGDILHYQTAGESIRDELRSCIFRVTPPVILLAHSLGGIIAVDTLAEAALSSLSVDQDLIKRVTLVVTAGSQAPFFYEVQALHGLPTTMERAPQHRLPSSFPLWLNFYEPTDLLSFVGGTLFGGRVVDVRLNMRKIPTVRRHVSYWAHKPTWQHLEDYIQGKAVEILKTSSL